MDKSKLVNVQSRDVTIIESNGQALYNDITMLIEENRRAIYLHASGSTVIMFWEIGQRINTDILENKRADYWKKIVSRVATQLTEKYGRTYALRNLRRMMQFNEQFPDFQIVSQPATQLSWAHIVEILPLKTTEAKLFYLNEAARGLIGRDGLRIMIKRKSYERKEIADTQISPTSPIPPGTFKDPYLFDVLGIKDEYLEAEYAIVCERSKKG